jgi:arsenate reductase
MKKILFICVENSCRSQMAEGWANFLAKSKMEVYSAGSLPSGKVNPLAIEVMKEAGVDISRNYSKGFSDLPIKEFDYTVTLGCADTCPFVPAKKYIDWKIDDPKGKDVEYFRKARDQIKEKVIELLKEI